MTTIAWDGKTLAGDRQVTSNSSRVTEVTKIAKRKDGALVGACGETCTASAFIRWFLDDEQGPKPELKTHTPECNAGAIVIRPNGKAEAHDQFGWHPIETKYYAMGSGDAFAIMAMRLGQSATKAVKLASEFDVYTNSKVNSVSLEKKKK